MDANLARRHWWWGALLLVALPVILGLLIPPKPLGAAAMSNREISVGSVNSASAPKTTQIISRPTTEKNVLDWLIDFRLAQDPAAFADQEAKVIGFVYRDERFGMDQFMVSRFVLSCCAADAAPPRFVPNHHGSIARGSHTLFAGGPIMTVMVAVLV